MTPANIPYPLMAAMECDWQIDWRGQSAGANTAGGSQVIYNRMPRWIGSPSIALVRERIDYWRAVRAAAQGRARPYRVPMVDRTRGTGQPDVTFSTGQRFSTGMGYAYRPAAICVTSASAGTTELLVYERDEAVEVGQFMSYDDWPFLVTWRDPEGVNVRIGIQMPLRRAIPAEAEIMLRATGLFRATDDTMGNPAFTAGAHFSTPQLSFEEWLNR